MSFGISFLAQQLRSWGYVVYAPRYRARPIVNIRTVPAFLQPKREVQTLPRPRAAVTVIENRIRRKTLALGRIPPN